MLKLYYRIMVSSIYTAQNNGTMSSIWKFASNFYFAFSSSIYILYIYLLLDNFLLNDKLELLIIRFTYFNGYNFLLNMLAYLIIPIMLINYHCFFYKNKYEKIIIKNNKYYSKIYFVIYFLMSFACMFLILFTAKK